MKFRFRMRYVNSINNFIILGLFIAFSPSLIFGVELKNWKPQIWGFCMEPLRGTKGLSYVTLEKISNYSVAMTYTLEYGRFGDQLTGYIKALWFCWKYDLDMVYTPFDYSDQLVLSTIHSVHFNKETLNLFSKKVEFIDTIEKTNEICDQLEKPKSDREERLLCIISYKTPIGEKLDDREFRKILRRFIRPKNTIKLLKLPTGCNTVAVHVRTGVGYDSQYDVENRPTKFPADTFYLNGLKEIVDHFEGSPLYVHIFTDHPYPSTIKDRYIKELKNLGIGDAITINCRLGENKYAENVLEDFFNMMQFDCVIHPDSTFTRCVTAICAPAIEIEPTAYNEYRKDENGDPLVDKNSNLIVDAKVTYRSEKGGSVIEKKIVKIVSNMLFD